MFYVYRDIITGVSSVVSGVIGKEFWCNNDKLFESEIRDDVIEFINGVRRGDICIPDNDDYNEEYEEFE